MGELKAAGQSAGDLPINKKNPAQLFSRRFFSRYTHSPPWTGLLDTAARLSTPKARSRLIVFRSTS